MFEFTRKYAGWEARQKLRTRIKKNLRKAFPTSVRLQKTYNQEFYESRQESITNSSRGLALAIHNQFNPNSVIDIGCGSGDLLESLRKLGCTTTIGLEGSDAGIQRAKLKGLDIRKINLERPGKAIGIFDICCCLEVAEHVEDCYAAEMIRYLTQHSKIIIFSAAPPGQGGTDHVNEQPKKYWDTLFAKFNYTTDEAHSKNLRESLYADNNVAINYKQNTYVYSHIESNP